MTARDRRRGASWRNLRHDLCLQKSIYQVSRQVGTQGKSPWVWASARRRLSAWALLEEGGGIIKIFATIICSKQCAPRIWLHWILAGVRLLSPRRCLSDSVLAWEASQPSGWPKLIERSKTEKLLDKKILLSKKPQNYSESNAPSTARRSEIWNLQALNEIRTKSFRKIRQIHPHWSLHQHHPIRIWTHRNKRLGRSDAFTKNVFNILIHKLPQVILWTYNNVTNENIRSHT